MKRYKLLFFIWYHRGKLRDNPGVKAKLSALFGYKSDGRFYTDWDFLVEEEFLKVEGGFIVATKKAQREFSFLLFVRVIEGLALAVAIVLSIYAFALTFHLAPFGVELYTVNAIVISAAALFVMFYFARRIYKIFVPIMPPDEELRNSGL